jgi:hypothetical protein
VAGVISAHGIVRESGRIDECTSQRYLYASNRGQRLLNTRDMIFREGGTQLILSVLENADGSAATYRIAMRPGESRQGPRGPRRSS